MRCTTSVLVPRTEAMTVSVPLTMTLKMALESDERTRWVAILLGSERDAEYALRSGEKETAADQATSTSS